MKKTFLSIFLLLLFFASVSCTLFNGSESSSVFVALPGNEGRMAFTKDDVWCYDMTLYAGAEQIFKNLVCFPGATAVFEDVPEGNYSVLVNALSNDKMIIATGRSDVFNVSGDGDQTVSVTLIPKEKYLAVSSLEAAPTSGTYCITTPEEILRLSVWSNDAASPSNFENVTFMMLNDVDMSDIADNYSANGWKCLKTFRGTFDGNGHRLTVKKPNDQGIRSGFVDENGGVIQNLVVYANQDLTSPNGNGHDYGFISHSNLAGGIIRNCRSTGSVKLKAQKRLSGILNENYGIIENCINEADLEISNYTSWAGDSYTQTAGICADNRNGGIIKNCVNEGVIYVSSLYQSGSDLNGLSAPISVENNDGAVLSNCFWKENTAKYRNSGSDNYMNKIAYDVTFGSNRFNKNLGTVENSGVYDASNTITPGSAENCGSNQTLLYGHSLLNALNGYVNSHSSSNALKSWKLEGGKVTLNFQ